MKLPKVSRATSPKRHPELRHSSLPRCPQRRTTTTPTITPSASASGCRVGFQIAGADQQWKPAEAKIVGETVVIRSAEVAQPVAVRYAWKDWPDYSLANGAGLHASPFRTDDWPVPAVRK